jgi:glycosyltransferase involved in cell wall biosynthesis
VVRLGYLDEAGRSALLRGASVFALPSRYEGFGFTPLEAMEAGVPVVATAVGSLPEVLGEAALFVPPGDDDALSEGLARMLDDDSLQTRLMKAGRNRLSHYSWKACADGLASLYRRVAAER